MGQNWSEPDQEMSLLPSLPAGTILSDNTSFWCIGAAIKITNSCAVYSAWKIEKRSRKCRKLVVKMKEESNAQFLQELNFYMRAGDAIMLKTLQCLYGLDRLAMPRLVGNGLHQIDEVKYRFLVFEKYGQDLEMIQKTVEKFPEATVYRIGVKILWCLKCIHDNGFIHGDVRGANILRDLDDPGQLRLMGFGRVQKRSKIENDKFIPSNLKYASRDDHQGTLSVRGDVESLAYNLAHWCLGSLPWEKLQNPNEILRSKEKFLNNLEGTQLPESMKLFMEKIRGLQRLDNPDYEELRDILLDSGPTDFGPLKFSEMTFSLANPDTKKRKISTSESRTSLASSNSEEKVEPDPKKFRSDK
jgi:vaccinia related kinase